MSPMLAGRESLAAPDIHTEVIAPNALLTRMSGHVTQALAERKFDQFVLALGRVEKPRWIIDQLSLTGFDPGAVTTGSRWFTLFKEREGQQVIFVSHFPGARMIAASLAFAAHVGVAACGSLREAYERLNVEFKGER